MNFSVEFTGHSLNINIGKVHLSGGWYHGEPFALLTVALLEARDGWVSVLNVQMVKFVIGVLVY